MQKQPGDIEAASACLSRRTLRELSVLLIDCQATSHRSAGGSLLEIAWGRLDGTQTTAHRPFDVREYPVQLPEGFDIPPAVQKITGISPGDMEKGLNKTRVWGRLKRAASETAAGSRATSCPSVIHFARFEEPFLKQLHPPDGSPFPLHIICTHEICKRLLPELPCKSLRAVAGYFGHSVSEFRRSRDHVKATAHIWCRMVPLLEARLFIRRLDQLIDWLARPVPPRKKRPVFPIQKDLRLGLPDQPGVYRLRRVNGDLLYIGKAKSLKRRVNSHFSRGASRAGKMPEMLTQVRSIGVTCTESALEAALMESDEIKRHSPSYNTALRHGRRKICYCSQDLRRHSDVPGNKFPIGPFPSLAHAETVIAFGHWHAALRRRPNRQPEFDLDRLLALPRPCLPESECAQIGVAAFCRKYRRLIDQPSPLRSLTAIGARIWFETMPETGAPNQASAEKTDAGDGVLMSEGSRLWSPETVQRAIEHAVNRAALLVRRSCWFRLLGNSMLRWKTVPVMNGRERMLVFHRGHIVCRKHIPPAGEGTLSPILRFVTDTERIPFDLIVYDRLRVATTEIKRLLANGRQPLLTLGCGLRMQRSQLERVLQWL
jgi:DNA polymerase-3 subunit epsilon